MKEYLMKIGDLIKNKRRSLKLSQQELEGRSGVTQSMISRIESNDAENASIELLRKLANALNCKLVDLLPESDKHAE
jgi:transcriptional regulator with XRE-family HTH domain